MASIGFVVAGLAFWMLGAIWYNVLGKQWQGALGFSDEYLQKGNMALKMILSLVCMIAMCFAFSATQADHFATEAPGNTFTHGMVHGIMVGIFYCATSMGINYTYQQRPVKLWAIDAVYQILGMAIAGGIISMWPSLFA